MANFFQPLSDFTPSSEKNNRKIILLWSSVILFLTIKITFGDARFFENHFLNYFPHNYYHSWYKWIYHHFTSLLMFALVPMIFLKIFLKENLNEYGIGAGDVKFGLKATLIAFLILPLPLYFTSHDAEHLKIYPLVKLDVHSPSEIVLWVLYLLPHYIGWEFFFRGYIGFGMKKHYGAFMAIMLQTLLTTLEHIGKPTGEIIGAIPAGIYLGLLCYRTNSIWWAVLFHWYLGVVNSYFCSL